MAALDWSQCPAVESVPDRRSGAWVFRGTRMPVATVFENLEVGSSIEEIIQQYDVTREQIQAVLEAGVRFVRTSGIPVLGGSDTTEATCRGHRGYSADHPQGSRGNSASSSGLFEKYWAHHRSHRDTGIGHVSEQTEKTWLSRAQRPAPFKFTLSICLTACTIRSSPKPTVFSYPFGSVPSAAV